MILLYNFTESKSMIYYIMHTNQLSFISVRVTNYISVQIISYFDVIISQIY